MITLRLVDEENFTQLIHLTVAEKDKQFVASNLRSLADCWLYRENGDVFPYAIYVNEEVIGFALVDIDDEESCYTIWRLMIDECQQGNGYGKSAILALIEQAKVLGKYSTIRADFVKVISFIFYYFVNSLCRTLVQPAARCLVLKVN
ncbi:MULTISPECIES: GNAT family N-acetyltransferase [unclassified Streptococcus]|uniref:GNAT family N-acetyltransferase n=1 Tax=unclassified Streptococcus TaxID=2608887 RepID=UPI0014313BA4|nr:MULTISPECIES: GNAT family N-acetyltransferase [unclassified Streptococcus]MBF0787740.1 GNAT family N-acetyltransferase [Streptococcus sp. 19428wC2_LYSM12]MCQ9211552.1 GNAT family N-acetyltransferase [Streptococcus sp. B01]MCQ9214868.1 GNAT family N-acetyltransferase [Streptococcus sp. O1]